MRISLFLFIAIMIASCNSDGATKTTSTADKATTAKQSTSTKARETTSADDKIQEYIKTKPTVTRATAIKTDKAKTNLNSAGIPDACDLLTTKTIAKALGINESSINVADGSSKSNNLQRACFFKWDGSSIKNAGVMVQVQKNPVADDVPEYFTYMISSKKTEGENNFSDGKIMKYKDWPGFGDDGAYSTEAGKYVWRIDNDWAFLVAFNTTLSERAQKKAAEKLAKEVMSRMTF